MRQLSFDIKSAVEAQELILGCEKAFYDEIDEALEEIFSGGDVKIIALAGPTCSGKTTTANKLTERIVKSGKNAVVLSIDDFFLDRKDRNNVNTEAPDYDTVNAIDLDYLGKFAKDLLAGKKVFIPRYSFTETARVGYEEYIPDERDIYVFEGIQAVYPQVTALFNGNHKSVFISVSEGVSYNGTVLSSDEVRLLRRLVRDYKFRNATAEFTYHLWRGVRDNEEKNIFPNAAGCDVHINSLLSYEPFIIEKYAQEILATVPDDSQYKSEAVSLAEKLKAFDSPYFDSTTVPSNSVFREFIG